MREDQTQLFKMGYGTRCETFGCGEYGEWFVGRPDGPLNTSHILCQPCAESLAQSVFQLFGEQITTPEEVEEVEGQKIEFTLEERLFEARSHAAVDEIVEELKLVQEIPTREFAKLQERKDAILAIRAK